MEPQEINVAICGLRIAAKVWGPENGEPVLAVHGWLDNAASYDKLAPLLPELRIVALDLPGHGRSEWRGPGSAYHFVDWLPDLFEVADLLGWERFAVIGHSMGAGVASMAAGTFPDRFSRLVLIEGLAPFIYASEDVPARVAEYIKARGRVHKRDPLPHADPEAACATLAKVVPNLSRESAALLMSRGLREVPGGVTWSTDPRLRRVSPQRFTEEQVRAFLRRITAPTLILWATDGWPFAPAIMQERIDCLADVNVQRLQGGHHLHLENAGRVAALVRRFFGI